MSKQFFYLFSTVFLCFNAVAQDANFKNYTQKIGGSPQVYDMVAIPGGEFMMGSPDSEKGRRPDEGPQHKVKIEPFWMGKTEVIWDIYDLYAFKNMEKEMAARHPDPDKSVQKTDASTRPSPPYVDMSFGMGRSGYPAINMTQYAAIHFCKWLYEKTGVFYRLPTEAEWEYACRAGSKTAYSFGADESKLDEYAWHRKNSDAAYKKIGQKKPNAFGLHDMHGNVMEWTLDQYIPDYYAKQPAGEKYAPVTELYPTAVRGGSWDDEPADLRSAARTASKPEWKILDPQLPKSEWWMTSASFVGFRVVRPLKQPSQEEINAYYSPKLIEDY
ncbi:formylglycine-generating enzyme family protein [Dyadobacter psychrophilus]|uniref:Formylglycine-generating enzyme, required for sulfatase activity, contains SUMF1/FGE domain n=1 Tax=Dyadobacter psychrophilus TaxID=651661 RepID=A0A1T5H4K0_9BACT|nr:formylglycine-generating enzyme family protein [Dyadobacter psychrophilus]SKC15607.1 Formylglycine-generating enzyme, required for sulfatase activity, contains SUMF1/FGE domain [Dyadobacter psychrophilus]